MAILLQGFEASLKIGWRECRLAASTLLLGLVGHTVASAQITSATIGGVVTDETGRALPGVEVGVKNRAIGLTRATVTASDGSYVILGLPPGVYDAQATLTGFTTAVQGGIHLTIAGQMTLNLMMRVRRDEFVLVAATAALIETKTSSLSTLVDEKTIQALPVNGRNFLDLAILQRRDRNSI